MHDGRRVEDPIRLAVIDDHPMIATAIETAAAESDGGPAVRVVGAPRTIAEALELVRRRGADAPDVVLCDMQVEEGIDGLRVVEAAVEAGVRAIVLSSFDRSSLMRAAFERGASGYVSKTAEIDAILTAVRAVAAGGTAFSAAALDAARLAPRAPSDRELAVLRGIQRGATSEEVGAQLGISARTVESHVRRLFDRYGVVSRAELAVFAVGEGWIEPRAP